MLKKLGRGTAATVLVLALYGLAVLSALVIVFGTAQHIKRALAASNFYNTFVDNVIQEAQKGSAGEHGGESGESGEPKLDQPIVQAAAKKALPPEFLQASAESALDGIYSWLHRQTPTPEFKIDLNPAKQTFANEVGNGLAARTQALPVCTLAQLQTLDANNLDLFSLPCRPPGVDLEAERQKVVNEIAGNKEFLNKPVLTGEDLSDPEKDQTTGQQYSEIPRAFSWLQRAPWIMGFLALLGATGVVLLFEERRRAWRRLGIIFLSVGLVLLLSFGLTNWAFRKISTTPSLAQQETGFQQSALSLTKSLASDVNGVILWFAIIYLAVAAGLIGLWWWLGKRTKPAPARVVNESSKT
jgi:hypothetical protein